jgi:hypothetical protein
MDREQILLDLKEWLREWYGPNSVPGYTVIDKINELEEEYE